MRTLFLTFLAAAIMAGGAFTYGYVADPASAHRSWCHSRHTCPSDHATYRWRGLLCVAPYSPKYNSTFSRKVVYGGRTNWCKR